MDANLFVNVNQIRVLFADDSGNTNSIIGTGFWFTTDAESEDILFITNAHNLDARLKLGKDTKFVPKKIEIGIKNVNEADGKISFDKGIDFFEIEYEKISLHDSADVACIVNPKAANKKDLPHRIKITTELLATVDDFKKMKPSEDTFFIGFPVYVHNKKKFDLWDKNWNLPVLRTASIASLPSIDFENDYIKTTHACLVTGLSFGGSSGSPIFSAPQNFIEVEDTVQMGINVKPVKLIGIMSGHFDDKEGEENKHSGMSYFTKSTAIKELVDSLYTEAAVVNPASYVSAFKPT